MKKVKELTPIEIRQLSDKGRYPVGGVAGLYLQVTPPSGKSWLLRVKIAEKRRDIGLGIFPSISLADAREKARELRELVKSGIDPLQQAKETKLAQIIEQRKNKTFAEVAQECHAFKKAGFKNQKHSQQWISTLETYAYPTVGDMGVDDIGINDVLAILTPIWVTKTETATRVRQRMATVFDYAITTEIRTKANPAQWKGRLDNLLAKPKDVLKSQDKDDRHHPALPVHQMNEFFIKLLQENYMSAWALAFSILTGSRGGEVRYMTWNELDINNGLWCVPGNRMKGGKLHKVPLSVPALSVLNLVKRDLKSPYVFRNTQGNPLSDSACKKPILKLHKAKIKQNPASAGYIDPDQRNRIATPNGFRSTLKDWARLHTTFLDEVSELALAHVNNDKTRAAYARNELLDERTILMDEWGRFCIVGESSHLRLAT
ncbi:integrase arm-type DNA-binding domain-containing protein [Cycloclasticus sp. P1]|uniref:tyrosine-type recombinase/integrase n=1 Tax=Cycloclasticus sp. (strain P1) TaxID=385025 RepID=UPI000286ACB7|nr:integrase arm-type DNA-binding domain-containing protein [Cycloclasticus sp. P1]AFT66924.1 Phage integrase family protein [Cycloclasticus sp. P1]